MEKEKKTRTPKNIDSIRKGALNLPLRERVLLRDELDVSIDLEVKEMRRIADEAEQISNGKQ